MSIKDIEVKDLSFSYKGSDRLILDGVEMHVNEGDFVCLLGQSGCGKSTFLRLVAGLEEPNSGSIEYNGSKITGPSLHRSVVFQDYGLFPWMSAGENIVLALRQCLPKASKEECKKIAKESLMQVGLSEDVFDKFPKELSGGMQQRCAIARSFCMNPNILLMDEPFGALDAVTRSKLQDMVLDLWASQEPRKTVFFVTHDVEEALYLSTRIVVFGQSPSHIIFQTELNREERLNRKDLYSSAEIRDLREELVSIINQDVYTRADE